MPFLGFLFSPIGKIGMVALAIALAFTAGETHGRTVASANAEARIAKATIRQLKERGLINEAVKSVPDCQLVHELNPDGLCDNGSQ